MPVDAGPGLLVPALILMAAAVALTALGVDAAMARRDSEKLFWLGFTGLLTVLLAVAWAVAESGSDPWVGVGAVGAAAVAGVWVNRRERRRRASRAQAEFRGRLEALERRHDAVLRTYGSYELDAWKAVEKPGLADLGKPETKGLLRAMKEAAAQRPHQGAAALPAGVGLEEYASAVRGLEEAWATAEDSAGDGRAA